MALTGEITALAEANRDLITAGARANREALLALTGPSLTLGGADESGTYTPYGAAALGPPRPRLMDEAL